MYEVIISPVAKADLDKFDSFERARIMKRLSKLKEDPYRVSKRLKGYNLWALKIGRKDYRAVFQVDENKKVVTVYAIEKRKNVYKNLQIFIFK